LERTVEIVNKAGDVAPEAVSAIAASERTVLALEAGVHCPVLTALAVAIDIQSSLPRLEKRRKFAVLDERMHTSFRGQRANLLVAYPLSPRRTATFPVFRMTSDGAIFDSCFRVAVMCTSRIAFDLVPQEA
jgi:hypothetical protein